MPLQGDRGAGKLSKACVIRNLTQEFEDKQAEYDRLRQENFLLRTREEVLLQQVTQQGDNLHFVALAAAQMQSTDMPDMAKSLMQDLEVHELMGMLGRSDNGGEDEPFTTQRLRAAVTPERVEVMRKLTIEEMVATLRQLTMRMCMLLAGGPKKAHLFSDSIEAVVNEYGEFGLLMHVAADWRSLEIGTLNLDTLQVQEPPPGYWENVVDSLELEEQQTQTLAMGFNSYQQKTKPIISTLHAAVGGIHEILNVCETSDEMQGQAGSSATGTSQQPGRQVTPDQDSMLVDSAERQQPGCFSNGVSPQPAQATQQQLAKQEPQQHEKQEMQPPPPRQPRAQQQQQRHALQQQRSGSSHTGDVSTGLTHPWQQFGLSHGCLTIETAEVLEGHMTELMQHVMKLREMHRTVTWLFLNVLSPRQHALFITGSWPWWSRPLTMCQYIAEKHEQQQKASMRQGSGGSLRSDSGGNAPTNTTSMAAAVADGVWSMQLKGPTMTGPSQLRGSTLTSSAGMP